MTNESRRILFLSHGGGPLPLLGDAGHREMVANLERVAHRIGRPSAILVVSAHWEAATPTITSSAQPELIYDYYGFPDAAYRIEYPCPGAPPLAADVHRVLGEAGIDARLDERRGLDHGVFVPLKIMYPQADIPCLQLSLLASLDPGEHLRLGRALARLDHAGLLVVGSGFTFHNMQAFFAPDTDQSRARNEAFEHWLVETCSSPVLDASERSARLEAWAEAPGARYCHPREEHLLPLHVCCGMAGEPSREVFELDILGKRASVYLW